MISIKAKNLPGARPAQTVKVWPASETNIVHPVSGPLRAGPGGTSWAADQFTYRRIADGSVLTSAPTRDLGRQREMIIEQKLAADKPKD